MIMFEEDFARENAFIHSNTKNKSFIHMYGVLKAMGIKNNAFFLALTQKELIDIDPHNLKDTSVELATRIAYEASVNPWYAIRELIRIPTSGGGIPYILNRANLALNWCIFNGFDIYLTQSRQTGKTISSIAGLVALSNYIVRNYHIGTLAKDNKLRYKNISRYKDIADLLPKYLINKSSKDRDNAETIFINSRNVSIDSGVAQLSPTAADNLGRGMSYEFVYIDEFEYFPNIDITYPILIATMNTVSRIAKENGLPSSIVLTSTAGKLEDKSCQFALAMIDKCMTFTESIYDSQNAEKAKEVLTNNSGNDMFYCDFSYLQLGYDNKWLEETLRRLNITDQNVIDRDFFGIRKSGSTDSLLTQKLLDDLQNGRREPFNTEITDSGYIVRWYRDKNDISIKSSPMIIGLDSSENIGKDFTEIYMVDATDVSVVMCTRCNESSIIKLALYIAEFMVQNSNTILVPERRSTGSMIVALICAELVKNNINPFKRIFNQIFQNIQDEQFKDIDIYEPNAHEGKLKKYLGFPTSGSGEYSRLSLYKNTFIKTIEANSPRIYDTHLITQMSSLSSKNGRIDHSSGNHDDAVVAYLLACWFIYFGRNIQYYDIDVKNFLSKVNISGDEVDAEYKKEQLSIRDSLEQLKKSIGKFSNDLAAKQYYLREIRKLENKVDSKIIDEVPISVDQFEKQINKNKIISSPRLIASCI